MTPERLAKLTAEAAQTGQAVISKEEVAEIVEMFRRAALRWELTVAWLSSPGWHSPTGDA